MQLFLPPFPTDDFFPQLFIDFEEFVGPPRDFFLRLGFLSNVEHHAEHVWTDWCAIGDAKNKEVYPD